MDGLKRLKQCFWQIPESGGIIDDIIDKFKLVMDRKKQDFQVILKTVENQFSVMTEHMRDQKETNLKLSDYIKLDKEIRERIYKKEMKRVSEMIDAYEQIPSLLEDVKVPPSKEYSGADQKMKMIDTYLTNAVVNADFLKIAADRQMV